MTKSQRFSKSLKIRENLKQEERFAKADIVLAYMDYRSEVMTTDLVEELLLEKQRRVFVPVVEGLDISFYEINSLSELHSGYQGIREPAADQSRQFTSEMARNNRCFLLLPGTVFDRQLGRLGYGKGFYDRFLSRFPSLVKAGLAFECQIAGKIPMEAHDIRMDMVVTENGIIR